MYSKPWSIVNIIPKETVKNKDRIESFLLPLIILWWHHVTVAPELSKIAVFKSGTEKGLRGLTPNGGHINPISIEGDKELWKNAQKKLKKNKISEIINNKKPIFKPFTVAKVWNPWKVDSLITSFNQDNKHNPTKNIPIINKMNWL